MANANLALRDRKPDSEFNFINHMDLAKKLDITIFLDLNLPTLLILLLISLIVLPSLTNIKYLIESSIIVVFSIEIRKATICLKPEMKHQ